MLTKKRNSYFLFFLAGLWFFFCHCVEITCIKEFLPAFTVCKDSSFWETTWNSFRRSDTLTWFLWIVSVLSSDCWKWQLTFPIISCWKWQEESRSFFWLFFLQIATTTFFLDLQIQQILYVTQNVAVAKQLQPNNFQHAGMFTSRLHQVTRQW